MTLNAKQKAFVQHYAGNAAEAAVKAGYAPGSAGATGARLLAKAEIEAAIYARQKAGRKARPGSRREAGPEARQDSRTEACQDSRVEARPDSRTEARQEIRPETGALDGLADRRDRQRFWTELMQDDEGEMKDRLKASELLGKSEGDFLVRLEAAHQGRVVVEHELSPVVAAFIDRLKAGGKNHEPA